MEGSAAEDLGAPESWEVADLDESMSRLMLASSSKKDSSTRPYDASDSSSALLSAVDPPSPSSSPALPDEKSSFEDVVGQVDQFLREALQNPRERLSSKPFEFDSQTPYVHNLCNVFVFNSNLRTVLCFFF